MNLVSIVEKDSDYGESRDGFYESSVNIIINLIYQLISVISFSLVHEYISKHTLL